MSVPDSLEGQSEACPSCGNVAIVPQATIEIVPPRAPSHTQTIRATVSGPRQKGAGGEQILWSGSPSWKAYLGNYFLAGLIFFLGIVLSLSIPDLTPGTRGMVAIGSLLLSAVIVVSIELLRRFTQYRVTDRIIWYKNVIVNAIEETPIRPPQSTSDRA